MVEFTIEQKVKAYDEALERAKSVGDSEWSSPRDIAEYIFPELKMSEDVKVRNKLIEFFKGYFPDKEWWGNIAQRDILAWLEEHDEQISNFKVGDIIKRPNNKVTYKVTNIDNHGFQLDGGHWFKLDRKSEFELVEQQSSWSKEDEMQLDAAIHLVSSTGHIETANWLKDLKNRVLQQNITITDEELAKAKKYAYNDALDKIEYHSGEPTFDDGWSAAIDYIRKKSLKDRVQPQSAWKPSDEQFKLLKHIMENVPLSYMDKSEVGELYLDLKKLRRE